MPATNLGVIPRSDRKVQSCYQHKGEINLFKTVRSKLAGKIVLALLCTGAAMGWSEDQPIDLASEFAALASAASADGQAWYQLARKAREAGNYAIATDALRKAQEQQFSAGRIAIERARLAVLLGAPEKAEVELQKLLESGFRSVHVLVNDPDINTLAGREAYDAIIAQMTLAAYPCEHDEAFRAFDFWLGDWEVHLASGQLAGHNSITSVERGCLILEQWTSASGGTGRSINFLDKSNGQWVQIWNDSSGYQMDFRGGMTEQGMLLEGQVHNIADGTTQPYRGLWTLLDDGRVRQLFELSSDDGKTWTTAFEGFYTRVADSSSTSDKAGNAR